MHLSLLQAGLRACYITAGVTVLDNHATAVTLWLNTEGKNKQRNLSNTLTAAKKILIVLPIDNDPNVHAFLAEANISSTHYLSCSKKF